jgi:hypothetical protein
MNAPKPGPPPSARRIRLTFQYARLSTSGRPMRCGTPDMPQASRKIIFDGPEDAEAWIAGMVLAGEPEQRAYACPRSRHGHYHVTSNVTPCAEPDTEPGRED